MYRHEIECTLSWICDEFKDGQFSVPIHDTVVDSQRNVAA